MEVTKEQLDELVELLSNKEIFQALSNNGIKYIKDLKKFNDEKLKDTTQEYLNLKKTYINKNFEKFFLPVSKFSKNEVELINDSGRKGNTEVLPITKTKNIYLTVGFDDVFIQTNNIKLPSNYSKYLDTIQMAIGSIMDCQKEKLEKDRFINISAEQVIRVINGLTNKDKVKAESILEVENAFRILKSMIVTCDVKELNIVDDEGNKDLFKKRFIINYGGENVKINRSGNCFTVFEMLEIPVLYRISKLQKQIRSIPIEQLKIKDLRSSKQNTVIKIWLLQQIESMKTNKKNGKHRINKINIKTLFESLKYDIHFYEKNERATKSKYIKQTLQILDYWKQTKYIKDYKQNLKNRSLQSIEIIL